MQTDNDRWMGSTEMTRLRSSWAARIRLNSIQRASPDTHPLTYLNKRAIYHRDLICKQSSQILNLSLGNWNSHPPHPDETGDSMSPQDAQTVRRIKR